MYELKAAVYLPFFMSHLGLSGQNQIPATRGTCGATQIRGARTVEFAAVLTAGMKADPS